MGRCVCTFSVGIIFIFSLSQRTYCSFFPQNKLQPGLVWPWSVSTTSQSAWHELQPEQLSSVIRYEKRVTSVCWNRFHIAFLYAVVEILIIDDLKGYAGSSVVLVCFYYVCFIWRKFLWNIVLGNFHFELPDWLWTQTNLCSSLRSLTPNMKPLTN